jgi:hypothetical protein
VPVTTRQSMPTPNTANVPGDGSKKDGEAFRLLLTSAL